MTARGTDDRGQWKSSHGFVLAALGSAIGLGNIWRFSYVVGENGGGAFIVVYLAAVIALGLPVLIAELAIGQKTRADAVAAFERISPAKPWRWTGWLGVTAGIAILAYYPVIAGWVAQYLWFYAVGEPFLRPGSDFAAHFEASIADPFHAVLWYGAVIAVAAAIVASGIERGIELASKVLMPLFVVLVVLLAGYGLSLPGASRAFRFLFSPNWIFLLEPRTYLAAIGQAFFSIGVAMAILVTYGSYLPNREKLPRAALAIASGDTLIALVAGMMIFPAVFSYDLDPAHGPTLAFAVLPEVFASMPGGRWIGLGFFLLLQVAALTSVMALLEVPVSLAVSKLRWRRPFSALVVAFAAFLMGLPAALGYGFLREILSMSVPPLDLIDHFASNIVLPLSGIAIALFAGWIWPTPDAMRSSGLTTMPIRQLWIWSLRVVVPGAIALVMIKGLLSV